VILNPSILENEERADEVLSSAHRSIFEQLITLEKKTDALLRKPDTIQNKLEILKLYFIGEVLICSIFKTAENETMEGRILIEENRHELNYANDYLNKINFYLNYPNEKKSIEFIKTIEIN
jgi:hypothetical protein